MRPQICKLVATAFLLLGFACETVADTNENLIERTYNEWVQATNAKDIERWSSFLAANAFFLPPGVPPLETEEAILNFYLESFADSAFSLDCQQLAVDVASSGETAWARGVCRATFTDANGQMADGTSRWVKVWLKQPDGSWKCQVNTWNYLNE